MAAFQVHTVSTLFRTSVTMAWACSPVRPGWRGCSLLISMGRSRQRRWAMMIRAQRSGPRGSSPRSRLVGVLRGRFRDGRWWWGCRWRSSQLRRYRACCDSSCFALHPTSALHLVLLPLLPSFRLCILLGTSHRQQSCTIPTSPVTISDPDVTSLYQSAHFCGCHRSVCVFALESLFI